MEAGALPRPLGDLSDEGRLQQTVLMMAPFGPGIRKQDEKRREKGAGRQAGEKVVRVGADEMEVGQPGPHPLPLGAGDSVKRQVDPDANLGRPGRRVGGEEMAVAAAYFQDDRRMGGKEWRERQTQIGAPLIDPGPMVGFAGEGFGFVDQRGDWAAIVTIRMLRSEGLTPLILPACPRV